MHPLLRDHIATTYFDVYQVLRTELIGILTDDDLAFRPSPGTFSLGELCREIGDIESSYIDAFKTFRQDFERRDSDSAVERDIATLTAWYADLDGDLRKALEALTEHDITDRRITRVDFDVSGFSPLPPQELDIYREALLIFYGKVSIYLRMLGRDLPGHWSAWIG